MIDTTPTPDFVFIDDASRPYLVSKGWLWRRHPDGQWVSLRELKAGELGLLEKRKLNPDLAKHYGITNK